MVRSAKRVSNHEAPFGPSSFETPRCRAALRMRVEGERGIWTRIIVLARQIVLRALLFPSSETREAERRQAPGCGGTRLVRTTRVDPPRPRATRLRKPHAGGRTPLGAPPRRFFGPEPDWDQLSDGAHERCPNRLTRLHSQVPLVVAGGRCRSGASRGFGYEPYPQDAASRSDSGSSPETPSVSGTSQR
jgi:hypothetical protein